MLRWDQLELTVNVKFNFYINETINILKSYLHIFYIMKDILF